MRPVVAEGINVGGEAAVLLLGDVAGGTDDGGGFAGVGQQPEVGEDGLSAEVEDVGGLDVAVDEAVPLEEVEGRCQRFGECQAFGEGQGAAGEEVAGEGAGSVVGGEGGPVGADGVGQGHGVGEGAVGFAQVEDVGERGMERCRRGRGIGQRMQQVDGSALAGGGLFASGNGGDEFDGAPAVPGKTGEPDLAVRAGPDAGNKLGLGEESGEFCGNCHGRGAGGMEGGSSSSACTARRAAR